MYLIHLCHVLRRWFIGSGNFKKEFNQLMEYVMALLSRLQIYSLLNIPRPKWRMVISSNYCFGKSFNLYLEIICSRFQLWMEQTKFIWANWKKIKIDFNFGLFHNKGGTCHVRLKVLWKRDNSLNVQLTLASNKQYISQRNDTDHKHICQ